MPTELAQVSIESARFRAADMKLRAPQGDSMRGEADILLAVFGVQDTGVPHGLKARQVIDQGAFQDIIGSGHLAKRPFYMDHGDATFTGYIDSTKLIGRADGWKEDGPAGLVFTGNYNLKVPNGEIAWEQVTFDPSIPEFSFRWPADEVVETMQGVEHVKAFSDVQEASQVGMGAQHATGVLTMRAAQELVDKLNATEGAMSRPDKALFAEWLKDDGFRAEVSSWLQEDKDILALVTKGLDAELSADRIVGIIGTDEEMARRVQEGLAASFRAPEPPTVKLTPAQRAWYERTFA